MLPTRGKQDDGRLLTSLPNLVVTAMGVAMVIYHLAASQTIIFSTFVHQSIHLAFSFLLIFLPIIFSPVTIFGRMISGILLIAGLSATFYVLFNVNYLQMNLGFPGTTDVVVGVILIICTIEATRRTWGLTLPIVATVFVGYFFLGHLLPGPLYHRPFSFDFVVSYLSVGLTGIYGSFLSISANQIFLFVVFGSMFGVLGIEGLLNEIGKVVGRRSRSGPAQTAVISSSLVGMITGASVANVAVTGAFTIPYMKRRGYSPELAGAIEATASTGGQLMPPVMGAAAFLMAFFIGVPYAQVMLLGLLPAALFYVGVMASVHFASVREGINAPTEPPDYRLIILRLPAFLVPITTIVVLLVNNYSPSIAAFWAIFSALVISVMRRDRPSIVSVLDALARGAMIGARIAVSLAVVGMIAQSLITTGLGSRLVGLVELLSAGNLLLALVITMVISIILGCGVPPAAAYSLVAITAAPALVRMGVPVISAHFFVFYFAIISAVTPPVAMGALAATALSGGKYFPTATKGFLLALSGFIIPFFIVFNPIMRLEIYRIDLAIGSLLAMPIAIISLSAAIYGYALRKLHPRERVLLAVAAISAFGFMTFRHLEEFPLEYPLLITAIAAFSFVALRQARPLRNSVGPHAGVE